jgi:hypothetical protein
MAIQGTASFEISCDGPNCTNSGTTNDALLIPEGWLQVSGPVHLLGKFEFCSGACYDNWKVFADQVEADYQMEQDRRRSSTFIVPPDK